MTGAPERALTGGVGISEAPTETGLGRLLSRLGRFACLLLLVPGWSTGCGTESPSSSAGTVPAEPSGEVVVFVAASLTDALVEVAEAFEDANPGVEVTLSSAGSSALREQILDGAPADVVATAGEPIMAELAAAGVLGGPAVRFASNRIVLATPAGNPAGVTGLEAMSDPALLVGLCDVGVPCGVAAREALAAVGVDPVIDTAEPDVRALLAKLAAAELDVGLVYATDVAASRGAVESVDLADPIGIGLTYPVAEVDTGSNPVGARAFIAFLVSATGRSIMVDHGFGP